MITNTTDLQTLCTRLASEPFVTIDTEFIREKTYWPVLCLVQLGWGKGEADCIDPLAPDMDLTPLFNLLKNQKVLKIFHAARQDIEIFYHLMGELPQNVFDTQIAAMVCGYGDSVSYQQLVEQLAKTSLDKSMRFTDWSKRPLSEKQIKYALCDVTHLIVVYEKLMAELKKTNRLDWLKQEQDILNTPSTYLVADDNAWKRIKHPFKKQMQIHVFARICAWREKVAKEKDRPRRHILKDETLLEIASLMPKTADDLDQLRSISKGFSKSDLGKSLLTTINAALLDKPDTYEPATIKKPLTSAQKNLLEMLKLLLSIISEQSGVAAKLLATTDDLYEFAGGNMEQHFLTGWRYDLFGEKSLALKNGKLALSYDPVKGRINFTTS